MVNDLGGHPFGGGKRRRPGRSRRRGDPGRGRRGRRQHRVDRRRRRRRQPDRAGDGHVGPARCGRRQRGHRPGPALPRDVDGRLRRRHRRQPPRDDARGATGVQGDAGGRRRPHRHRHLQLGDARRPLPGELRHVRSPPWSASPEPSRSRAPRHGIKANAVAPGAPRHPDAPRHGRGGRPERRSRRRPGAERGRGRADEARAGEPADHGPHPHQLPGHRRDPLLVGRVLRPLRHHHQPGLGRASSRCHRRAARRALGRGARRVVRSGRAARQLRRRGEGRQQGRFGTS